MSEVASVLYRCNNGGCTRPIYRGKECFVCWAGTKWDSMKQRTDHRHGRNLCYTGISLKIKRREFILWALLHPPPHSMKQPSIDRIETKGDYTLENIRWLELKMNNRHSQRDTPAGFWICSHCHRMVPLTPDNFYRCSKNPSGFQTQCKSCRRMLAH